MSRALTEKSCPSVLGFTLIKINIHTNFSLNGLVVAGDRALG